MNREDKSSHQGILDEPFIEEKKKTKNEKEMQSFPWTPKCAVTRAA